MLQDDVVDRKPERHGNGFAGQVAQAVDIRRDRQRRTVDVVPGDDFGREFGAVTDHQRGRRQQMDYVDLPGQKRFDQLRPGAEKLGLIHVQAFLGIEFFGMSDQQRRRVGNRQITDAQRMQRLRIGAAGRVGQFIRQQCRGAEHGRQLQKVAPGHGAARASSQLMQLFIILCSDRLVFFLHRFIL